MNPTSEFDGVTLVCSGQQIIKFKTGGEYAKELTLDKEQTS